MGVPLRLPKHPASSSKTDEAGSVAQGPSTLRARRLERERIQHSAGDAMIVSVNATLWRASSRSPSLERDSWTGQNDLSIRVFLAHSLVGVYPLALIFRSHAVSVSMGSR